MLSTKDVPPTTPELIPFLEQTNAQAYCQLAASVLILYEHLALLGDEIEYMWKWTFTAVTALFLVNRYTLLVSAVLGIVSVFEWKDALSCEWFYDLQYALTIMLIFVIAWFSALRVYAVSRRSWWPAVLTLAAAVVAIPVQLFADIRSSKAYVTVIGSIPICSKSTFFSEALNTRLILAVRLCAIFSDLIVLCYTWYFAGIALNPRQLKGRFMRLIIQQGTVYFISLLVLNVVQIVIETSLGTQTVNAYYTATFTGPISSILIARFMLDLRAVDQSVVSYVLSDSGAYSESTTTVELTTMNFSEPSRSEDA